MSISGLLSGGLDYGGCRVATKTLLVWPRNKWEKPHSQQAISGLLVVTITNIFSQGSLAASWLQVVQSTGACVATRQRVIG